MTTLEAKMHEWARANRVPVDDNTWDQNCGRAMFRFNSWLGWVTAPKGDIHSAWYAAMGSGWLNPDRTKAPIAAWHWFDIGGKENGHVMQEVFGGDMAGQFTFGGTRAARATEGATALGFLSVQGYLDARPAARYLGWSTNYSGGRPSLAGLSSSNMTPLEDDMPLTIADVQLLLEQTVEVTPGRWVSIAQSIRDQYFYGEHDSAQNAATLAATNESIRIGNVNWQIVTGIKEKPSSVIDPVKLAAELKAAGLTVTIDSAALVKAIDASLSDDFAAIPGAVRDAIIK